jgi:hypothetical protein
MAKTTAKPSKRPFYNPISFMRNYLAFTDRDWPTATGRNYFAFTDRD